MESEAERENVLSAAWKYDCEAFDREDEEFTSGAAGHVAWKCKQVRERRARDDTLGRLGLRTRAILDCGRFISGIVAPKTHSSGCLQFRQKV